ncbi:hypothetical protein [Roseibium polysiphoniae]|uniref:hypothetical protein n=1 Tax=Roseibium polysiphoniae TaxID=2571221 RepID=UPI00329733B0
MTAHFQTTDTRRPDIFFSMASGRLVNLTHPMPEEIHWPDLIENLVKLPRFGGATYGVTYTVAQHCCLMYDHADTDLKPAALVKNFHKAFLGELTWSAEATLQAYAAHPTDLAEARELARDELDDAIFRAAGIPEADESTGAYAEERAALNHLSRKLQATEARDLMQATVAPTIWANTNPFPRTIRPWGQDKAREELENRLGHIGLNPRG